MIFLPIYFKIRQNISILLCEGFIDNGMSVAIGRFLTFSTNLKQKL
jgi:hypothetical protein